MNEMLKSIRIRKLVLVWIIVITLSIVLSELPIFKQNPALDSSFWLMITDFIFLLWFIFKIYTGKVSVKPEIHNFKASTKLLGLLKIVVVNIVLSSGFILLIAFAAYRVDPGFMQRLLNEAGTGSNGSFYSVLMDAAASVLIAPVIEEFMFRGIILNRLKIKYGTGSAIIISSFLFGILHYKVAFFGAFFFGIIMSLLYIKSENIFINISIHFINNLLMSMVSLITYSSSGSSANTVLSYNDMNFIGIAGAAALIVGGFFTLRFIIRNWPCSRVSMMQKNI